MSVQVGQSIITNGLVLHLDPKSSLNYVLSEVEVLVVAGGGGGGSFNGGGGGGGGVIYINSYSVTPGSAISVTVGNGGVGDGRPGNGASGASNTIGTNGGNSVFGNITSIGGGVGSTYSVRTSGVSGGSGGGGWGAVSNGGSGTSGQGNNGGGGYPNGNNYTETSGGGGGAGGKGLHGGPITSQPGYGGPGLLYSISGSPNYYGAGGGAGANRFGGYALGGSGVGGDGGIIGSLAGKAGTPCTGSGGGGAAYNGTPGSSADGGAGGSGTVIVRYPGPQKATGGNSINFIEGYTIHIFTSSGTFTPLSLPSNNSNINGLQDLSGNNNHLISRAHWPNTFTSYGVSAEGAAGNNNVTFTINGDGTFIREGFGQKYGDYTIKPTDIVYRYNLGSNGCHYHGNSTPISTGNFAVMEVDYYISPDATGYPENGTLLVFENYGGSALSGSAGVQNSAKGIWQTLRLTAGPTSGSGTQAAFLYPGACGPRMASSGYILMKNPRLEIRNTSSPIVPVYSTGGTGSILLDGTYAYLVKNNFPFPTDDFTVSCWVKSTDSLHGLLSYSVTGNDNHFLLYDNDIYLKGSAQDSGFSWSTDVWTNVTVTRSTSGTVRTYNNGVLVSTLSMTGDKMTSGGTLIIGNEQDSTGVGEYAGAPDYTQGFSGNISSVQIYNRILSASEVLKNFNTLRSRFGI